MTEESTGGGFHATSRRRTINRRDLRTIFAEGVAFSVMVGIGESYLPAFVLALGMGEVTAGLIATVPLVAGGLLQLSAPLGIRLFRSYRRWSVWCASVQAAAFIPLFGAALIGSIPTFVVFLIAAVYWAAGMAIVPAWNLWVERLVPTAIRTRYFARRTSAANFGILAGLLAGGLILEQVHSGVFPLLGFALLFAIAGVSRFTSAAMLFSQHEPDLPATPHQPRQVLRLMRRFPQGPGGALLTYMLALTLTVMVAGPFFTPFMLRQLELSYAEYMSLLAVALAAKVVAVPLVGRVAHRLNMRVLLRVAWMGTAVVPALWLVSGSYPYLMGLQVLAGAAWGAHELVTFLLLFEMIPAGERGTMLTVFNFGHSLATAGGSLLGAFVFEALGGGITGYYVLFGASFVARLSCVAFLVRVPGAKLPPLPVAFRSIAVRPSIGVVIRPILATLHPRHQYSRKGRVAEEDDANAK